MNLMELTAVEAKRLSDEYLALLIINGVGNISETQNAIYNGLYCYADCINAERIYNSTEILFIKEAMKEQMIEYADLVRQWEPYVNQWLESGMPLDI